VGICASGNYLAGAIWPPLLQHFFETAGWRATYIGVGLFCIAAMVPLVVLMVWIGVHPNTFLRKMSPSVQRLCERRLKFGPTCRNFQQALSEAGFPDGHELRWPGCGGPFPAGGGRGARGGR